MLHIHRTVAAHTRIRAYAISSAAGSPGASRTRWRCTVLLSRLPRFIWALRCLPGQDGTAVGKKSRWGVAQTDALPLVAHGEQTHGDLKQVRWRNATCCDATQHAATDFVSERAGTAAACVRPAEPRWSIAYGQCPALAA
jgi:hypothetical protein